MNKSRKETSSSVLKNLTVREREVLALISDGLTTRQIAKEFGISPKTVETHRTNMMYKLDVHSAAEMVSCALKAGIITG